jgi:hypothetical protein
MIENICIDCETESANSYLIDFHFDFGDARYGMQVVYYKSTSPKANQQKITAFWMIGTEEYLDIPSKMHASILKEVTDYLQEQPKYRLLFLLQAL